MEIIIKLFKSILTPVLAGVFFIMLSKSALAWEDYEHANINLMGLRSGYFHSFLFPSGYSNLKVKSGNSDNVYFLLHSSDRFPILSRLHYSATNLHEANENLYRNGNKSPSNYNFFVELRFPLKMDFLSHETSWFLQYENKFYDYRIEAKESTYYANGEHFNKNDRFSLGEVEHFFAVALDTPVTNNDFFDSYSRFGFYYSNNLRNRALKDLENNSRLIMKVDEKHGGIFYEMRKPVFFKGFALGTKVKLGFGTQKIRENSFEIKTKNKDISSVLLFTDLQIEALYRLNFGDSFGLGLEASYNYKAITSLSSSSSKKSSLSNNDSQYVKVGLFLDLVW